MPTGRAGTPRAQGMPPAPTHRLPGMQARSPSVPQRLVPASPCNNSVMHMCSHQAHLPRAARTHKTEFTEACPGPNACGGPAARGVVTQPPGEKGRTESGRGGLKSAMLRAGPAGVGGEGRGSAVDRQRRVAPGASVRPPGALCPL